MSKFEISNKPPSYSEFETLWNQMNWSEYSEEDYITIHSNNPMVFCVRRNNLLIGYCRLLTDFVRYAYIQDLIVDSNERNNGVGTIIINAIIKYCKSSNLKFIGLFSTSKSVEFYYKLGFTNPENGNVGLGIKLK